MSVYTATITRHDFIAVTYHVRLACKLSTGHVIEAIKIVATKKEATAMKKQWESN